MILADWPLDNVRIQCVQCSREGKFSTESLEDRYGDDMDMAVLLVRLAHASCKPANPAEICKAILADAMLVDAISDPNNALVPDLVPEALELRRELGLPDLS